ncbi:30S ribosomal protein S15 [archaeon]|nr:30S ribosomal protein S15 [archaeon]
MSRIHARKKGKSGSKKPPNKTAPSWVSQDKAACETLILELAKEGKTASDIGRLLRDEQGIPSIKAVTGKNITDIMKENKMALDLPEDLMNLIKKAVNLRKHMENNKKDLHNKRGLALIEAKIKRLQRYYKTKKVLPKDWYYEPEKAALLVK